MVSKSFVSGLLLLGICHAQTATTSASATEPTCGLVGYDEGSELGYYGDSATAIYSSYSACNTLCNSNTACLSFAIDPSVACILYSVAADNNVAVASTSPWTFFNAGGVCPTVSTTSSTVATATATPTCSGLVGYDAGGTNIGYYTDSVSITYGGCLAQCSANSACLSFGLASGACILYDYTVEGNDIASPGSGNTFYDAGGKCASTSAASSTTVASATATPTCVGFVGYDKGGTNIGYYSDATSATYSGCDSLCNANAECLSFSLTSTPACILYNYTVEGNDISSPGSGNTFYDRGGACPSTTTSSATTASATTPVQTGAFANCPSNEVAYNVSNPVTPYTPCNSTVPYSSCMADVDGSSTYCNLCGSCGTLTTTCTSDADCGAGYACIENSACPVTGYPTGSPVCLYMLLGGSAYGCYDALELA
ncbi:hypothetical protein N0V82_010162 [Gnomoniopsis sp. IMI 355080]|nr:hypothetical protein N0V82_010162 [Gnomoniopsis sp. IMI 355080]